MKELRIRVEMFGSQNRRIKDGRRSMRNRVWGNYNLFTCNPTGPISPNPHGLFTLSHFLSFLFPLLSIYFSPSLFLSHSSSIFTTAVVGSMSVMHCTPLYVSQSRFGLLSVFLLHNNNNVMVKH